MMKKRSRLRKRVREWLKRRKERKEQKQPLPSFGTSKMNHHQEPLNKPNKLYQNEQPTGE